MIRDTSIIAYREIRDSGRLGELQWLVYHTLYTYGPLSRSETATKIVGATRDGVHQRFSELRRMGLIKLVGKRKCSVTGKLVNLWDVTSKIPANKDYVPVKSWPFAYTIVVLKNGEWEWFIGTEAKETAIKFSKSDPNSTGQVIELKGRNISEAHVAQEQRHQLEGLDSAGATPVVSTNFKDESSRSRPPGLDS